MTDNIKLCDSTKLSEYTIRIINVIKSIPEGKVLSYRDAALAAGIRNGARQTVRVLHSLSEKYKLPWHRVIRSNGSIALREGEGRELQISLLRAEGVEVSEDGKVDMKRFSGLPNLQVNQIIRLASP